MGLLIAVYRPARNDYGDLTNGGISGRFDRLVVVDVDGPFEPNPEMPGVRLARSGMGTNWILVPVEPPEGDLIGPMDGGNLGVCSDSRMSRATNGFYGGMPIHDRFETQATYDLLST